MTFTYSLDDKPILEDIQIPLKPGTFIILTGVENQAFSLIGGIVAGMFPLGHDEQVPRLEELIRIFKGTLELSEGSLPGSTVYLGPDPEKHLLFSRIDEEVGVRSGLMERPESVLALFHLPQSFIERRISSLSGGEKMRLALAIAFSKRADCTVLHGVVPWLDGDGKECLIEEIEIARKNGRLVLLLEQEIDSLQKYADGVLFFDGQTLHDSKTAPPHRLGEQIQQVSQVVKGQLSAKERDESAVEFKSVDFRYDGTGQEGFQLKNLSFELKGSRIYGLIGDNGTGKSTIANLILRLEKPMDGEIYLHGRPLGSMSRKDIMERVCYVSQFPEQHITLSSVQQYRQRMEKRGNTLSRDLLDRYFDRSRAYPLSILSPLELKILSLASSGESIRTD
jgi:ABC-type Mn2+/Zn2+ transport system ATPase subunit